MITFPVLNRAYTSFSKGSDEPDRIIISIDNFSTIINLIESLLPLRNEYKFRNAIILCKPDLSDNLIIISGPLPRNNGVWDISLNKEFSDAPTEANQYQAGNWR